MIKISSSKWGEDIVLNFPDGPGELPLNRYIDFFAHTRKANYENPIREMSAAVAVFAGVPLEYVLNIPAGESGIGQLFSYALKQLQKWVPPVERYSVQQSVFEYKGEKFFIRNSLLEESDYSVGEAIEAFETIRMYGDAIQRSETITELAIALSVDPTNEDLKKRILAQIPDKSADLGNPLEIIVKHGDPDSNRHFSRLVKLVAIFARKEGELLPATEMARSKFISERMRFFQEIDTKTALDVDFFLLNMFTHSRKTVACIGSLIRPLLEVVVEMNVRRGRHTKGQSNHRRRFSKKPVGGPLLQRH